MNIRWLKRAANFMVIIEIQRKRKAYTTICSLKMVFVSGSLQ